VKKSAQVVEQKPDRPHVAGDTRQLGHDHADIFGTLWGLGIVAHQLFDGQCVAEVVAHAGQVVEPVGEREIHQERIAFTDLLMVAVHVAHHRLEPDDGLAVDPQVEPEDAVRARVLRSHAHDELVGVELLDFDPAGYQTDPLGIAAAREARPVLEVLGDFHVCAKGIDLLRSEVLPVALVHAAGKYPSEALRSMVRENLCEGDDRRSLPT